MRRHELCHGLAVGLGKLCGELGCRCHRFHPPGVVMRSAQFLAFEQIGLAENSDQTIIRADDRQCTDIMVGEKLDRIGNAGLGFDGHDVAYHNVFGFHRYLQVVPSIVADAPSRARAGNNRSRAAHMTRENTQYSVPEISIAAGNVSTQAIAMLRTVANCSPEPFAAMVPAIPDDSTWVVETGRP